MKLPRSLCNILFLLLAVVFLARADEPEKKRSDQLMSNGEDPKTFVQKKIDSHDVMVFARSYGPHNHKAKDLLKQISHNLNVQVEFLDVDLLPGWDSSLIMVELQELTGQWSFPNIFIGKKHVGGNQELDQKHALGELEDMMKSAGQEL